MDKSEILVRVVPCFYFSSQPAEEISKEGRLNLENKNPEK